jgi:hypothetical protein
MLPQMNVCRNQYEFEIEIHLFFVPISLLGLSQFNSTICVLSRLCPVGHREYSREGQKRKRANT